MGRRGPLFASTLRERHFLKQMCSGAQCCFHSVTRSHYHRKRYGDLNIRFELQRFLVITLVIFDHALL